MSTTNENAPSSPFRLFAGHGVELEYMIVSQGTLDVMPIADKIIFQERGDQEENDVYFEDISWSNELALHVIEFKNTEPRLKLTNLHQEFEKHIRKVNGLLQEYKAKLLPTSMHPWMNPKKESFLWPHGNRQIYKTYDKLFDCTKGHGWTNLQSVHLNLAFYGDEEFALLHEAIRLVLPLLPSLVASSPFIEGKIGPGLDTRLWQYKDNQKRIASIIGHIIPEPIVSKKEYEEVILSPMYQDIAPYDTEGILQNEWLNSRAAIARFERNAIEIRLLDIQECPLADLSMLCFITEVLKYLGKKNWHKLPREKKYPTPKLKELFLKIITQAEETIIDDQDYLSLFGLENSGPLKAKELWPKLLGKLERTPENSLYLTTAGEILNKGSLARRILKRLEKKLGPSQFAEVQKGESEIDRKVLREIYQDLADCLGKSVLFES